jgi:hypothetical protein
MSTQSKATDAATPAEDGAIRPFKVEVSEEELDELRRRVAASRLPSRELVQDRSQGVQKATVFPGEIYRAPRSWAERVYPNLIYFNEVERGGHFAAWEEPELFTTEMRAAFNSLR